MNNEWKDVGGIIGLAHAISEGMEIEMLVSQFAGPPVFTEWHGTTWSSTCKYRARPKQPKRDLVRVVLSDDGKTRLYIAREPECAFNDWPNAEWDRPLSSNEIQGLLKNPYGMFAKIKPPTKPAMKKVKSLCYRDRDDGDLLWRSDGHNYPKSWQRFPAGDIEGEVET
jgi:hypothetical protein